MSFQFKQFSITQIANAHKVGTDSMVLGAWVKNDFKTILDIGTGTGILALMQAQNHPHATVVGIEPRLESYTEAKENFINSPFSDRLSAIHSRLQEYEPKTTFDLIICNPPYFIDATLGTGHAQNIARHAIDLSIHELYNNAARLLAPQGQLSLVFPADLVEQHIRAASSVGLHPKNILVIETEEGKAIRQIISYAFTKTVITKRQIIVKYSSGMYSKAYVELTANFHNRNLPYHK